MEDEKLKKRQMKIYVAIAFGVTYLMGFFMWYGYTAEKSLFLFPNAQMFYPAAGVVLLLLLTRPKEEVPRRFFFSYLLVTGLLAVSAAVSVFWKDETLPAVLGQAGIIGGSVLCGILMLTEKREKRIAVGLKGRNWKASIGCVVLFVALYTMRVVIAYALGGELGSLGEIMANPMTWVMLVNLALNFFLTFLAFFGEEYGWRWFLQPVLQKQYGKRLGVIVLGVVWALWHLPIDFFYYTTPDRGVIMVASQIVTCISLGVFFAYAYMKTNNIWVPVILHYLNNNLVLVFSGVSSADILENQTVTWGGVLFSLVMNGILFLPFLFAKEFKKEKEEI